MHLVYFCGASSLRSLKYFNVGPRETKSLLSLSRHSQVHIKLLYKENNTTAELNSLSISSTASITE